MFSMRMRRLLSVLIVAAGLIGAVAHASGTQSPALSKLALRPAQVGSGYRMALIPGGNRVSGQVSLDLCGQRFPSETQRTGRLQVAYRHQGNVVQISNELVRYRSGAAREAMRELRNVAAHCPRGPVTGPVRGVGPLTYRLTPLTDERLLGQHVAVKMRVTGRIGGKPLNETAIAVYQIRGDVLSAVYTDGHGTLADRVRVGLHAAEQSADKLRALVR
jgi:hypothetical protein